MSSSLSKSQQELLEEISTDGRLPDYLAGKTLQSLVSRGLVCVRQETMSFAKNAKRIGEPHYDIVPVVRYYLTQEGFEALSKILTRRHLRRVSELNWSFRAKISAAQSRIAPPESSG